MPPTSGARGQDHKRLAWITLAGLALAVPIVLKAVFLPHLDLWHAIAGDKIDGSWRIARLDGDDVWRMRYLLHIRWGAITGGRDGCNFWAFSDEQPDPSQGRMTISTLVGCQPEPCDRLYGRFAHGQPRMRLIGEDRLEMVLDGHRAELVRLPDDALQGGELPGDLPPLPVAQAPTCGLPPLHPSEFLPLPPPPPPPPAQPPEAPQLTPAPPAPLRRSPAAS